MAKAKSKEAVDTAQADVPEVPEPAAKAGGKSGGAERSGPTYSAAEYAANSRALFGVGPDIVLAAFRMAGKVEAEKEEAASLITAFAAIPAH